MRATGLIVILIGLIIVVLGALIWLGAFSWFGRLPGDFRYEGENVRFYFPLASMLIISLLLSFLFNLLRRFF
ncbi:DUF2905 domain-containing protein [Pyrinomonas methylaliphatogenes]|mgnify:CR=1 FL=1|uniref:DUF2905 domain-containing protein n=1 Tax=Pyrinomonas methylaliphatogenes TaxID=454194 RepID=A0A0B6WZ96_9BACT|nr:DUF2905 domain-containing protein [Pyrinomonas methylaliphatogenes]MBX5478177.1 DUF2905 domain-containing protein [Pyrinomonas methylaliphatogenes]CDM66446.1 Protein of unknown function (DUF2905) [Pyrinomonas methylaliphatogenes]